MRITTAAWALSGVLALGAGCGGGEPELPPGPATIQLHAHGLKNQADRDAIRKATLAIGGVTNVRVDEDGTLVIRVSDGRTTGPAHLEAALDKAGYHAHSGGH